ncbi:MAG: hypothetical protein A2Y62_18660 [Candidatus Fischerbacteria bacterium RBG_13_37_8]|uniref:Lipid A biosynthesis acyltransferase n=1 Tax=Candidatus Fischerbacteria bacterium RBG_13_37_8 TaxID=1817863 RepID=A0A1F5VPX4_9BACT|nr:MAG: hypothetical protein A2Y62_18660 [Candidatus Fischerbacteria bacterium RBG_13_37_8]
MKKNYPWKFFKLYLHISLHLPEFINNLISRIIIALILPFFKKNYIVAMLNILLCFKKAISTKQQHALLKQSLQFSFFSARQVVSFLYHKYTFPSKIITMENQNFLDETINKHGKALIVSGHFGVFPLIPLYMAHNNFKISVIIKPPHNQQFRSFIFDHMTANNIGIIPTSPEIECFKKIHEALLNNHSVMFMIDQTPTRHQAHTLVKFFDWNTLVYPTINELAKKHNLPILPIFTHSETHADRKYMKITNLGKNKGIEAQSVGANPQRHKGETGSVFPSHIITCYPPINAAEAEDVLEQTNRILEDLIMLYPWQWWWFHKKWYNLVEYNNPAFYKYAREEPSRFFAYLSERE